MYSIDPVSLVSLHGSIHRELVQTAQASRGRVTAADARGASGRSATMRSGSSSLTASLARSRAALAAAIPAFIAASVGATAEPEVCCAAA